MIFNIICTSTLHYACLHMYCVHALTSKQLLGLLNCLRESIEYKSLVLTHHGLEPVSQEADDELILNAATVVLLALVDLVKQLLSLLCPSILLLLCVLLI